MQRRNDGFTLVEVMISSVVLGVLVLAVYALLHQGSASYADASRDNTLQENSRRVLDRISEELRMANPATLIVGTQTSGGSLSFQVSAGFKSGVMTWGTVIQYQLQPSIVDANTNSIQDDYKLVRIQDGQSVKLCDYVQAGGFVLSQAGTRITITLNLGMVDEKRRPVASSVTTSVSLRTRG